MSLFFYALYALIYLGLMLWAALLLRSGRSRLLRSAALAQLLILGGLFYDNLILALGNRVGAGDLLLALSVPRFVLHQLILPWLIWVVFVILRVRGHGWAQKDWARIAAGGLSLLVVVLGVLTRLVGLDLAPTVMDGVLRYVAVSVAGPPLVSIVSVGLAGVGGLLIWRRSGWPWLFVTVALAFLAEALPIEALKRLLGSGAEVALMIAVLWLLQRAWGDGAAAQGIRSLATRRS